MEREIVWTKTAINDLAAVLSYLDSNWPGPISETFIVELQKQLKIASIFPDIGQSFADYAQVRRILITEHNALFYDYDENKLYVLKIVDTRSYKYKR